MNIYQALKRSTYTFSDSYYLLLVWMYTELNYCLDIFILDRINMDRREYILLVNHVPRGYMPNTMGSDGEGES
jgi:hypothetical protein